ncbi:MAG TPA: SAM-dependent methyltransferase, partial [Burkholderiaceae bacterium]|nr:SAM-dependent methyltransferase [Burkholderiaceae bacterium]
MAATLGLALGVLGGMGLITPVDPLGCAVMMGAGRDDVLGGYSGIGVVQAVLKQADVKIAAHTAFGVDRRNTLEIKSRMIEESRMASISAACAAVQDAMKPQRFEASALYVVATPLGNTADLTFRAIAVLHLADLIAAEDTRHAKPLLERLGVKASLIACHEHNEREAAHTIVARLKQGERVAYISDAGTPGVSDPGGR